MIHLPSIIRSTIKATYFSVALALVTITSLPAATAVVSAECVVPSSSTPGVNTPTGSDSAAFTYNCGSGLWESSHATFNPATGITTPKEQPVVVYNATTNSTDTSMWVFSAAKGDYVYRTTSVAAPVIAAPAATSPAGGTSIGNTGPGSTNSISNPGGITSGSTINGTGPNSTNAIDGSSTNNGTLNNNTSAALNNGITATANTGNALTLSNLSAGGAASGNAQDIANVVNLLQSSSNALGGDTVTFVANIDGDVNGDLFFDPAALGTIQPAGRTGPAVGDNNLTINNQLDASINNNIDLTAHSGDATVSGNTEGGDATTGNATTIANVVNLINSAVTSGKSFLGIVNINGNLNGDILIPDNFVDQLLAANVPTVTISTTGPDSTNTIDSTSGNNTTVNNTNDLGITNAVNATAASGAASVAGNTSAGSATSGSAGTHITAFNLTGSNVVGANSILVFVNVLGSWVGLIVNAPAGATAAQLGGGITQNDTTGNNSTTLNNDTKQRINNNITTAANSGDATVTRNTTGGDATSGDAKGAVNLLNVQNSSLALSNWFGILFINVFGTWHGSFGVNTSAGDPIAARRGGAGAGAIPGFGSALSTPGQTFSFVPTSGPTSKTTPAVFSATPDAQPPASADAALSSNQAINAVLAASTLKSSAAPTPQLKGAHSNFGTKVAIIALFTVGSIVADAVYTRRKQHA